MLVLIRNPEDRFSHEAANKGSGFTAKEEGSSCATSGILAQPDITPSEAKTAVSDLSNTSSVFLTPKTSPNKDDAPEKTSENSGETKQQPMCRKVFLCHSEFVFLIMSDMH